MIAKVLLFVFTTLLLTGCLSSDQPYVYHGNDNLFLYTLLDPGAEANIVIYQVDDACQAHKLGVIDLNEQRTKVALEPNKLFYLVINFKTYGSFLIGDDGSLNSIETLLQTRKEESYHIKVSYLDALYDIEMKSSKVNNKKVNLLPIVPLSECHKI